MPLFELSNHLGNVLVTISDKKLGYSSNDSTVDYFNPQVVSAQDYYPFGMLQPGREFNVSGYRYGFNGKENDNEVKGEGNQQDYGMRIYDPRLGRFLSVDPLVKDYPWYSSYQFAGNKPVWSVDLDGLEEYYYSAQWNNKTGKIEIKLDKVVDQKSILGIKWTPSKEVIVTFKTSYDGKDETKFTFTEDGHLVRNDGMGERVNKIAAFEKFKKSSATNIYASEEDAFMAFGGENGAGFYSEGALTWNFVGNACKDFYDHGGAAVLNARIGDQATAANQGNKETSKLGGRTIVIDENLKPEIGAKLKELGYKVKIFPSGTLDADILTYAERNKAIVVTNNLKDFNKWGITTMKVSENMKAGSQVNTVVTAVENVNTKATKDPSIISPGKNVSLAENKEVTK